MVYTANLISPRKKPRLSRLNCRKGVQTIHYGIAVVDGAMIDNMTPGFREFSLLVPQQLCVWSIDDRYEGMRGVIKARGQNIPGKPFRYPK